MRVYVTGRLAIEAGSLLVTERDLPSRQARLVLAYLIVERRRAVTRDELAELVWSGDPPRAWATSLSAIVSTLRAFLGRAGLARSESIVGAFGCYRIHLPPGVWIDREAAVAGVDQAEGALRAGDPGAAFGWAGVATAIARRPFLPGEEGAWVDRQRAALRDLLVRALDCFAEILAWNDEPALAIQAAREAVALEPLRETGYRRLMRIQAAAGNRGEALRAYDRCRRILSDELGVDPSPDLEATYLEILRS